MNSAQARLSAPRSQDSSVPLSEANSSQAAPNSPNSPNVVEIRSPKAKRSRSTKSPRSKPSVSTEKPISHPAISFRQLRQASRKSSRVADETVWATAIAQINHQLADRTRTKGPHSFGIASPPATSPAVSHNLEIHPGSVHEVLTDLQRAIADDTHPDLTISYPSHQGIIPDVTHPKPSFQDIDIQGTAAALRSLRRRTQTAIDANLQSPRAMHSSSVSQSIPLGRDQPVVEGFSQAFASSNSQPLSQPLSQPFSQPPSHPGRSRIPSARGRRITLRSLLRRLIPTLQRNLALPDTVLDRIGDGLLWVAAAAGGRVAMQSVLTALPWLYPMIVMLLLAPAVIAVVLTLFAPKTGSVTIYRLFLVMVGLVVGGRL